MPRQMPGLASALLRHTQRALKIVKAGEITRAVSRPGSRVHRLWPEYRLEALSELAYLRVFVAWEVFLESAFYRYLCGYQSITFGQETTVSGRYYRTIDRAQKGVLATLGKSYLLWENPASVI